MDKNFDNFEYFFKFLNIQRRQCSELWKFVQKIGRKSNVT